MKIIRIGVAENCHVTVASVGSGSVEADSEEDGSTSSLAAKKRLLTSTV